MNFNQRQEKRIGEYFYVSIILKGLFSLGEVVVGCIAFFVPVSVLTNAVFYFTQGELLEDPGDFIASHLAGLAHEFAITGGTFIAVYLVSRGAIKLGLVFALLKNQLWAYPSSLAVLGLFVAYQVYEIVLTHSLFLIALSIFDLVVMWFIWREYEVVRSHAR